MAATVATVLILAVALAPPAAAHTVSGVGASNFVTRIIGVSPALPGVSVRVIEAGSRLELTNSGADVIIYGYNHTGRSDDDQYLRVGRDGVFENRNSPATYLNRSRTASEAENRAALRADPTGPPRWVKVSDGNTARWHDHRAHWMGKVNPPVVRADPDTEHAILGEGPGAPVPPNPPWRVDLSRGDVSAALTGTLAWVPGPSPLLWVAVILVVFGLIVALAFLRKWNLALAAALVVVLAFDLLHAFAIGFAYGGGFGTHLFKTLTTSIYSLVGWLLAVLAIRLLVRRSIDGLYATVFAGLAMALFGGLLDVGVLSRSIAPFALSMGVDRLSVAVTLGGGVGLAAASIIAIRRNPEAPDDGVESWPEADDSEVEGPAAGGDEASRDKVGQAAPVLAGSEVSRTLGPAATTARARRFSRAHRATNHAAGNDVDAGLDQPAGR